MALVPFAGGSLVPAASAAASAILPAVLSAVSSEPARKIARRVGVSFAQAAARQGTNALQTLMANRLSYRPPVGDPVKRLRGGGPPPPTQKSVLSGPHMGPISGRFRPSRRALYLSYRDSRRRSRRWRRWRRDW